MIGNTISLYRIIARLGQREMGVVYEAEDLKLGRHVALKILSDELTGRRAEARSVLGKLDVLSKKRYAPPGSTAMVYAALGEKERAFEWLEMAYEDRSILCVSPFSYLKLHPAFEPLRSDPRFADLLRRMNLNPITQQ